MEYQQILFEVDAGVATITLNRPEQMNTWTGVMAAELWDALARCDQDDTVRAVVLTGAGDRAFCAGADLSGGGDTFSARDTERQTREERADESTRLYPNQISKPVIAAINGHAVGVGMTYPMLADVRIAAENAKLAFPFVRRGVLPELGSHVTVAQVAGLSNAAELLLTGKTIKGREAAEMGIVSRALPQEQVLPAAMEIARDIAQNTAPASVAVAKRFLWEGVGASVADMMNKENRPFAWLGGQPDAREGVMSFVEKRPPQWSMSAKDIPEDLFRDD
ncbi:MAG: enoyl-CoA hydratase-related protein [Pseudomonadales bacterium]|jgi:enoyl-CoA hydratase/carnithine racemase|nr:enoyl-CoA hydratase-related protein [Pseudomonadales bacterium]MDP6470506.1 enoyl-CoA hydratase-related protein [Pseudomonadales bacterium]MDP6827808.1 enoyl-CoA hydratase-related protein [Pseudomonadales bacterium]MDP6972980.1 enoyl-CoA hydratase-related protein [Pseudomonadales bacterium]